MKNYLLSVLFVFCLIAPTYATMPAQAPYPRTRFVDYRYKTPNAYYQELNKRVNPNVRPNSVTPAHNQSMANMSGMPFYSVYGGIATKKINKHKSVQTVSVPQTPAHEPIVYIPCYGSNVIINFPNVRMNCKPSIASNP